MRLLWAKNRAVCDSHHRLRQSIAVIPGAGSTIEKGRPYDQDHALRSRCSRCHCWCANHHRCRRRHVEYPYNNDASVAVLEASSSQTVSASGENHWRFLFRRTKVRGPMPYSPMTVVLASFCNARSETSRCSGLPHERATPRRTTYCASFGCQVTQIPGTFSMKNPSPAPLLHGRPERAGTVRRVPAAEVEALVGSAVREHLEDCK